MEAADKASVALLAKADALAGLGPFGDQSTRTTAPGNHEEGATSDTSAKESAHVLVSEPTLYSEPTLRLDNMRASEPGMNAGMDKAVQKKRSNHPRPPPLDIPNQTVISNVGMSPFQDLTPLDNTLSNTHKLVISTPPAEMPLLSPFLGSAHAPSSLLGHKHDRGLRGFHATPGDDCVAAEIVNEPMPDLAAEEGEGGDPSQEQPGSGKHGGDKAKEWSTYADRMADLDAEEAEAQICFLSDSVIHGMDAAAQRRARAVRKAGNPLMSPLMPMGNYGRDGMARYGSMNPHSAELFADDTLPTYQVHCYAPGMSTPVMVSEYPCSMEACMATEHMNMMIEAPPMYMGRPPYPHPMPGGYRPHPMGSMGRPMDPYAPAMMPMYVPMHGSPAHMMPYPPTYGVGGPGPRGAVQGPARRARGGRMASNLYHSGGMPYQSQYLGVEWDERRNGWAAYIEEGIRRRPIWLTRVFATEEEAARARDRELLRRNKHTQEQLNFPDDVLGDADDDTAPQAPYHLADGEYEDDYEQDVLIDNRDARVNRRASMGGPGLIPSQARGKRGNTPSMEHLEMVPAKKSRAQYQYKDEPGGSARKGTGPNSKYRGVVWDEAQGLWRSQVMEGGQRKVLGHYESQEEAARAYDMAVVRENRKEKTNFPPTMYKDGNMMMLTKGARGSPVVKVTSQYKGVSWNSACSKWVAVLWDRELKRARHIGSFESEELAARAYDREAIKMLGTDAGLNFRESLDEYVRTTGVELLRTADQGAAGKGSSQYRGVSWHERSQRWEVRVWGGGKQHFIGSFTDEIDAARAYDKAVLRLRGQDARSRSRMNFPLSDYNLEELLAEPLVTFSGGRGAAASLERAGTGNGSASLPQVSELYLPSGPAYEERPARRSTRQPRPRHDDDMTSGDSAVSEGEQEPQADASLVADAPPGAGSVGVQEPATWDAAAPADARASSEAGPAVIKTEVTRSMVLPDTLSLDDANIVLSQQAGLHGLPPAALSADPSLSLPGYDQLVVVGEQLMVAGEQVKLNTQDPQTIELLRNSAPMHALISVLQSVADGQGIAQPQPVASTLQPTSSYQPATSMLPATSMGSMETGGEPRVSGGGSRRGPSRKAAAGVAAATAAVAAVDATERSPRGYGGSGGSGGGAAPSSTSGQNRQQVTGLTAPAPVASGTRGKSQFRGVSWCEKVKKWRALLWDGTKQRFLGHYITDQDAARAYDRALLDLKGPDAKTNFPASTYENEPVYEDGARRPSSSQYKGVSYNKSLGRWESRLRYNGRTYIVGSYLSEVDAARAHDCASLHLRGPAANFPYVRYPDEELLDAARKIENAIAGGGEADTWYTDVTSMDGTVGFAGEEQSGRRTGNGRRRADSSSGGSGAPLSGFVNMGRTSVNGGVMSAPSAPQHSTFQVGVCLAGDEGNVHPVVQQVQRDALQQSTCELLPPVSSMPGLAADLAALKKGYLLTGGKTADSCMMLQQQCVQLQDSTQPRDQYSQDHPASAASLACMSKAGLSKVHGHHMQQPVQILALDESLLGQDEQIGHDMFRMPTPMQLSAAEDTMNGGSLGVEPGNLPGSSATTPSGGFQFKTGDTMHGYGDMPMGYPAGATPMLPHQVHMMPAGPTSLTSGTMPPGSCGSTAIPDAGMLGSAWPPLPALFSQGMMQQAQDQAHRQGTGCTTSVGPMGMPPVLNLSLPMAAQQQAGGMIDTPGLSHLNGLIPPAPSLPPSLGRGKSQFRGVSWHVVNNKYIARIRTNCGGNTHLGCFDSQQEAAQAYDVAAIALRGPHQAITNFPAAQYLTDEGALRPELLDILARASTPIIPLTGPLNTVKRRPGNKSTPASSASAGALAAASGQQADVVSRQEADQQGSQGVAQEHDTQEQQF